MTRAWLVTLLLALAAGACIDFQEAENHYCATHDICPDAGFDEDPDAGTP